MGITTEALSLPTRLMGTHSNHAPLPNVRAPFLLRDAHQLRFYESVGMAAASFRVFRPVSIRRVTGQGILIEPIKLLKSGLLFRPPRSWTHPKSRARRPARCNCGRTKKLRYTKNLEKCWTNPDQRVKQSYCDS
jgi:hypothetical protein